VADLLAKLAGKFSNRKRRVTFLVNNYDCVCSVLREAKPVVVDAAGVGGGGGGGGGVGGGAGAGSGAGAERGGSRGSGGGCGGGGGGGSAGSSGQGGLSLDNSATYRFFDEQLTAQSHVFVEEELADHFGPLIDFVKKAEAAQRSAAAGGGGAGGTGAAAAAEGGGCTPRRRPRCSCATSPSGGRQGLALVHFSAQLEPCLAQEYTLHTLNTP